MGGELRVAEGVYRRASTAARQEESRTSFATQLVEVQPQADQTGKLDEMRTELLMELGNSRINHR